MVVRPREIYRDRLTHAVTTGPRNYSIALLPRIVSRRKSAVTHNLAQTSELSRAICLHHNRNVLGTASVSDVTPGSINLVGVSVPKRGVCTLHNTTLALRACHPIIVIGLAKHSTPRVRRCVGARSCRFTHTNDRSTFLLPG